MDIRNVTLNPRNDILKFIINNPSAHLRKIKKVLGYSMGTIQYHVVKLENEGIIVSKRNGFYKNYFHVGETDQNDVITILNLESPRKILLYVAKNEPCSHMDIAKGIGLSSSTVSWHMKKLVDKQIVQLRYDGKFSIYFIKNKSELFHLLDKFKSSTWNDMADNMAEMFIVFQQE